MLNEYSNNYVGRDRAYIHFLLSAQCPTDPDTAYFQTIIHPTRKHLTLDPAFYPSVQLAGWTTGDVKPKIMIKEQGFDANESDQNIISSVEGIAAELTLTSRSRLLPIWSQLQRGIKHRRDTSSVSGHTIDRVYADRNFEPLNWAVVLIIPNAGRPIYRWIPKILLKGDIEDAIKKGGLLDKAVKLEGEFLDTHPYPFGEYTDHPTDPDA